MRIEGHILSLNKDKVPYRMVDPEHTSKDWCVLWLQGWTSSMDSHLEGVKRMAKKSKTTFFTMDYAGHGSHEQSIETSTRKQQHIEVVAIYDRVKELGYKKVLVIGGSFGGYMTALLTGVRDVNAVIMRAPANYPDEEFEIEYKNTDRHKNYAEFAKRKKSFNDPRINTPLRNIGNFEGFVYILEHELDEVVPRNLPMGYFKAAKHGNYLIIPRTKHSPKTMQNKEKHFEYIENTLTSLIGLIKTEL